MLGGRLKVGLVGTPGGNAILDRLMHKPVDMTGYPGRIPRSFPVTIGRVTQRVYMARPALQDLLVLTQALDKAGLVLVNKYAGGHTPISQYDRQELLGDILPEWTSHGVITQNKVLSAWARIIGSLADLKALPKGNYDLGCLIRIELARNLTRETIGSALKIAKV